MTIATDFGALPPEVNSAKIYSGRGSASMLSAATAWNGLAADLRSAAASYTAVILGLTSDAWRGRASTSMAAAAAPYAMWMNTTAAQAEQTAVRATAAAAAYEAAFAAAVPPPVIAANRSLLVSLIATNILGQNTPAIAATEAHYGEMWAQDATAMYSYAGSSAVATEVTQFSAPQQNTSVGGLADQAAAVTHTTATSANTSTQAALSQLMSGVPPALQNLATPASSGSALSGSGNMLGTLAASGGSSSSGSSDILGWLMNSPLGPNANIWNTIFSSGFFMPSNTVAPFLSLLGAGAGSAVGEAMGDAAAGGLGSALAGPFGGLAGLGGAVSAGAGQAASIGSLSVPATWTAIAPPINSVASVLGGTPLTAPPTVAGGFPGIPLASMAGRGAAGTGVADTRYLTRPPMLPHWPAVG